MGYIKVAYQKINKELDYYKNLPDGWDDFVKKHAKKQNLIIRHSKNRCYCTNCKNTFFSKKKVNDEVRCPHCHMKYLIKRSNLRHYCFKDYLSILDRVNDIYVIRYFELRTDIDVNHNSHYSAVEFAREFIGENYYKEVAVNERVAKCQCHISIYHFEGAFVNPYKWREYTRNYDLINYSIVFPNNLKKLFKGTKYQYSCIWELVKNCKYIDLEKMIKNANEQSLNIIERLTKMKLYNLALRYEEFYEKGNFESIFGVPKSYYKFMKRHNITYLQLKILALLKECNINKIRYLQKFTGYFENIDNLKDIADCINLNKFIIYTKKRRGKIDIDIYKDYLKLAKMLGFDLKDKKYLYPKNLNEEHDKLSKEYKIQEEKIIKDAIERRGKELDKNKYSDKKFIVFPAYTLKGLNDESEQQNNCVRTYAEDYANGTCDIYFMRNIKKQNKSLVTIEVRKNRVVQSRTKCNHSINEEQDAFLQKWENKVLKNAA